MADALQPNDCDVLLGRGNHVNLHPGNMRFRKMVAKSAIAYEASSSLAEKDDIARLLITEIAQRGGRFLRPTQRVNPRHEALETWKIASDREISTKVKQAMRDDLKRKRKESAAGNRLSDLVWPQQVDRGKPEDTRQPSTSYSCPIQFPLGYTRPFFYDHGNWNYPSNNANVLERQRNLRNLQHDINLGVMLHQQTTAHVGHPPLYDHGNIALRNTDFLGVAATQHQRQNRFQQQLDLKVETPELPAEPTGCRRAYVPSSLEQSYPAERYEPLPLLPQQHDRDSPRRSRAHGADTGWNKKNPSAVGIEASNYGYSNNGASFQNSHILPTYVSSSSILYPPRNAVPSNSISWEEQSQWRNT